MKDIYAKKDGQKKAHHQIDPNDVISARVWVNMYGNPSHGFIMSDGTHYLIEDDYGAMNDINHLSLQFVSRKKDL